MSLDEVTVDITETPIVVHIGETLEIQLAVDSDTRVLSDGDTRVTSDGDDRIIEEGASSTGLEIFFEVDVSNDFVVARLE